MARELILNLEQQDEIDNIQAMLGSIHELLMPSGDFSFVGRDGVACLLNHFLDKLDNAQDFDEKGNDTSLEKAILQNCIRAINELLLPRKDGGVIGSEALSSLIGYLSDRLDRALKGDL
jgi:hypothetical protein